LHDPAKFTHSSPKYLEDLKADTAHIARTADFREEMKPQSPHAEPVPVPQRRRLDPRIGYRHATQPPRIARQRIEQHPIIEAVRVALH
jgi:hypothetical protein